MKANKLSNKALMIGDYMKYKDGTIVQIARVGDVSPMDAPIYCHTQLEGYFPCQLDDISPIPLTGKILEKNGFTCDADGMNDSDELTVSIEYGEYQRNTDDGFKMLADGKVIKYVHELQHALRLCEIKKEIEL